MSRPENQHDQPEGTQKPESSSRREAMRRLAYTAPVITTYLLDETALAADEKKGRGRGRTSPTPQQTKAPPPPPEGS